MSGKEKNVYLVHAVDTEGPISESIEDTFERLKLLFDLDFEPSYQMLAKLQNKEISINGLEDAVANCISPKRLAFIKDLSELDNLLDKIFSRDFRENFSDSLGNPYRFSWFCIDHVGFEENPRRRLLGFHTILKHYIQRIRTSNNYGDTIQWHYHGVPFNKKVIA